MSAQACYKFCKYRLQGVLYMFQADDPNKIRSARAEESYEIRSGHDADLKIHNCFTTKYSSTPTLSVLTTRFPSLLNLPEK